MKKLFFISIVFFLVGCQNSTLTKNHLDGFERKDIIPDEVRDHEMPSLEGGYELMWADEFNEAGKPNSEYWSYDTGGHGWGNNEQQLYTTSTENSYIDEGTLKIKAIREQNGNNTFTSGRLVSRQKQDFKYGKFEIRAKIPGEKGSWPAIWMLPTNSKVGSGEWPDSGEIDIMEHVGNDKGTIHGTIHTKLYNHKIGTQKSGKKYISKVDTEFHVYGLEWNDKYIATTVDGVQIFKVLKSTLIGKLPEERQWEAWPFEQNYHMILNVAMGGSWGGNIPADVQSSTMEVDYVRVYQNLKNEADVEKPSEVILGENTFVSSDRISLEFDKATDNIGIKQYDILVDGKQIGASRSPKYVIKNLVSSKEYKINVLAVDWNNNYSISPTYLLKTTEELNTKNEISAALFAESSNVQIKTINDVKVVTMLQNSHVRYLIYSDADETRDLSLKINVMTGKTSLSILVNDVKIGNTETLSLTSGEFKEFKFPHKINLKKGINEIVIQVDNDTAGLLLSLNSFKFS